MPLTGVFYVFVKIRKRVKLNVQCSMNNKRFWEIIAKVIVAALTAALTAVTTTSCMGYGPVNV